MQSHVRQHSELAWILNCVASMGELRRMTQFKEKSDGQETASVGLFDYPVLQAADVLLYQAHKVPVGEDQRQHLELMRDLAQRFNRRFGETFVVPEASIPPAGARIVDLQEPEKKMSTTRGHEQGTLYLLDPPTALRKKVMSAVTDSGSEVRYDPEGKPGVSGLMEILGAVTDRSLDDDRGRLRLVRLRRLQARRRGRRRRLPGAAAGPLRRARRRPGRVPAHPGRERRPRPRARRADRRARQGGRRLPAALLASAPRRRGGRTGAVGSSTKRSTSRSVQPRPASTGEWPTPRIST